MNKDELNEINITSPNLLDERLVELKRLFPDLFDGNGNLNEKELKDLLSEYTTPQVEKFTFEWGGKSASKKLAFSPSKATLIPDKERSVNFDETENMIIEGDNLHVLKLLQASYANKIKCIYIDPPYNTGKDFIYSDNFDESKHEYWEKNGQVQDGTKLDSNAEANGRFHSNWLSMMQSRLLLARRLLSENGVLVVSIDDNEIFNLKKLMDEVFGEENFVANLIRKSKSTNNHDKTGINSQHEYLLFYAKSIDSVELQGDAKDFTKYKNPDNDPNGDWISDNPSANLDNREKKNVFEIINPYTGKKDLPPQGRHWSFSEETYKEYVDSGKIIFKKKHKENVRGFILKRYLSDIQDDYYKIDSLYFADNKYLNQVATKDIYKIFDLKAFEYTKPTSLLKKLVSFTTSNDDIVLDFFAGSGTTGHAVMDLNKEDRGNRKFILVQIPEYTEEDSEVFKAGFKTISDITIERVKRAGTEIAEENSEVDTGFKVFKQFYSHFPENTWKPDPNKSNEENQELFKQYLERSKERNLKLFDDFEFEPVLYEILLKQGFELTFELQEANQFTKNKVNIAKDSERQTYICLDKRLEQETVDMLLENHTNDRFICIENALDTTNKWKLSKALGKNLEVIS